MRLRFPYLCAAAAIALVPGSAARVSRSKRAWAPSDPQAFEVTLSFDNDGRYLAPIGMVRRAINGTLHQTSLTRLRLMFH